MSTPLKKGRWKREEKGEDGGKPAREVMYEPNSINLKPNSMLVDVLAACLVCVYLIQLHVYDAVHFLLSSLSYHCAKISSMSIL